uniref:Uncharacterized protein n=1 Tax=Anopheles atroparvus TaxID=41427 RepID=A0A182IWM8_ANOAO
MTGVCGTGGVSDGSGAGVMVVISPFVGSGGGVRIVVSPGGGTIVVVVVSESSGQLCCRKLDPSNGSGQFSQT